MALELLVKRKISRERAQNLREKIKSKYCGILEAAGATVHCNGNERDGYHVRISYENKIEDLDEIPDNVGGVKVKKTYDDHEEESDDSYE